MFDRKEKSAQEVIRRDETAIQPVGEVTPMRMLQVAVEKGTDLEQIEKLMELERQWKADIAREAYNVAITEFKKNPITVVKDKKNKQYDSYYASLGNKVNTVNLAMAPFGLNARWNIEQGDLITVTCILSHTLGHSESVPMSGLPDDTGKKNEIQKIKSTITYLKSETFEAVTGIVSIDAPDDDGNGASDTITEDQVADLEALITEVGADKEKFLQVCKIDSFEHMRPVNYAGAVQRLQNKRRQP